MPVSGFVRSFTYIIIWICDKWRTIFSIELIVVVLLRKKFKAKENHASRDTNYTAVTNLFIQCT